MAGTVQANNDASDASVNFLKSRVRTFISDPLHSAAYLNSFLSYLSGPVRPIRRYQRPLQQTTRQHKNAFLYSYDLSQTIPTPPTIFDESSSFLSQTSSGPINGNKPELVVLAGCPSPEWLNAVVARYGVDYRLLHRHLDFLPNGQRDWYTAPTVPSRSNTSIRLMIPSIVFVGPEGRYVRAEDLHKARTKSMEQLRLRAKAVLGASASVPGQSIVRNVNIHSGDTIVIEQAVTITVLNSNHATKGSDESLNHIPVPDVAAFRNVAGSIQFCPVFFENALHETSATSGNPPNSDRARQPFSVLSSRYGETLDWKEVSSDPVLIIRELFSFQAAASMQYLNMLRKGITQLMAQNPFTDNGALNMEGIMLLEYSKSVLVRWSAHFKGVLSTLDSVIQASPSTSTVTSDVRKIMSDSITKDLRYLQDETAALIDLCESGESTILSSFSLSESKRTALEAQLVTKLTKATNRLTFIFLPISFVTSVFGMNFRQFGQGNLSILLWVAVTIPLLTISVAMVEWGGYIATLFFEMFRSLSNKI